VESTIESDADFVAMRSARGSIVGARLSHDARSLWCMLAADSTFGAAVSTLWSLSVVRSWSAQPASAAGTRGGFRVGDPASPLADEIRVVLERAREVLAAVVLSEGGEPLVGLARGGLDAEPCLELLRRRTQIFDVRMFGDSDFRQNGPESTPKLDALGFTFRTIVTGERSLWCFGAELAGGQTLWVLTERSASQGLGWACLSALGRGLGGLTEARRP
jgi:hypothetical protein